MDCAGDKHRGEPRRKPIRNQEKVEKGLNIYIWHKSAFEQAGQKKTKTPKGYEPNNARCYRKWPNEDRDQC
uniref:Uncharacterized protein n=1 Tax=Hyaloperonospora arabidopsidis (strain Emoy2) TaxID=559515 RepID=M4BTZ9_HYAAE